MLYEIRITVAALMYLIYDEAMVKEATYNTYLGILFGGQICDMNVIRYADDKAVG